ncbi:hypothetical protein VP395_13800 [Mariniflexile soesokkakense]|uniref:Virulence-protein E N-terminal domain-containing protein n=1 Tax=Mariniflexile soesokkakense TaxID=1343160 RepID=A0ABV0ACJ6_9FLAO
MRNKIVYINKFNNIKSPQVLEEIDLYSYLYSISNTDKKVLERIEEARYLFNQGCKEKYEAIKCSLPCYTLNFGFDKYKINDNIIGSTGLIYLDLDNETKIDLTNELIFASWMSLSNNGRGILVQIDGLTKDNFKYNYTIIAEKLGIEADKAARKATQYTVQSYDSNLYINEDSTTFKALDVKKKIPNSLLQKKKRSDSIDLGIKPLIRFNTINDYNFNEEPYIYFPEEKESIGEIYIPKRIEYGARNTIIFAIGLQFRGFNPFVHSEDVSRLLYGININHCKPPLEEDELLIIVRSIMSVKDPKPLYNKERRILFNPKKKYSRKEKMAIINPILGKKRREKTYEELKECVKNWNYEELGKVTEKKLIKASGKSKNTVRRYYRQIKDDPELF